MSQGKAILFIDIKEDKEQDSPKFEITDEAMRFLQSLGDRKVAVLTIAGPQRSGKSFLANRILKQQKGFEIGPTTNPCTKGIWLWNQPVILDDQRVMLIMDTEGLNSVQRNQTIDMQIFSLSILLSSMFVYNNLGHIDEQTIQNLALVVKLSENICVKSMNEEESLFGQFSPNFLWVLRDFSLALDGKTPKEYLEQSLKSQAIDPNKPDMALKNEIRDKFRQFFPRRDCLCLVRPIQEEEKLRRIEHQDWNSLRPEFRQGIEEFEKKIFQTIPVKKIGNQVITGKMFLNLTLEYLDSINSGGVPIIVNSLERVRQAEVRKISEDLRKNYKLQIQKVFPQEQMPFSEEDMLRYQKIFQEKVREHLHKQIRSYIESDLLIDIEKEILEFMDKDYKLRIENNAVMSKSKCGNVLRQIMQQFQVPNYTSLDEIKSMDVRERQQIFIGHMREYFEQAKGPFKYKTMAENGPLLVFDYFFQYTEKIKSLYQEEINKMKIIITQNRESEERLRKIITDYEKTCDEIQVQASEYKQKYEKTLNEKSNQKKQCDFEISLLNKQIDDLKSMMAEQSDTDYSARSNVFKQADNHISEIKAQNEIAILKEKIKMMENLLNGKIDESEKEETMADQYLNLRELKQLTVNMKDWLKKKLSSDNNHQFFMDNVQKLNDEKYQYIKKFNDDLKQKKQEYKSQLEEVQKLNEKRFKLLQGQLDELKTKNLEMTQKLKELDKKEQQIKNLVQEKIHSEQNIKKKAETIDAMKTALECQKIQTEKHDEARLYAEQKYASFKAEQCYLDSLRQTYPYILQESFKSFQKKKNLLQKYLNQFQPQDKDQIIQVLREFNVYADQ